jgi:hypothetical protein
MIDEAIAAERRNPGASTGLGGRSSDSAALHPG